MGHFSHFRFPKQEKQPAFIKTKKQYVAFYVPAHYYFPERILQPLTKLKRAHKQDSSLWIISLIMPLYVGCHFVFFPFAPKQIHAALLSWRTTPAGIAGHHVAQKYLKLLPSWKITPAAFQNWFCNADRVVLCESYWWSCRRCWARFSCFSMLLHDDRKLRYLLPQKS